jgi:hypothetical protein
MVRMPHLKPTITFILPIQTKHEFLIEQINAIFRFSENYGGLCEILLLADETGNARLKLASLAIKMNGIGHPYVKMKMIRYTSTMDLASLIEAGIHNAIGEKIVVAANSSERIRSEKLSDAMNRQILVTQYILDIGRIKESLS